MGVYSQSPTWGKCEMMQKVGPKAIADMTMTHLSETNQSDAICNNTIVENNA